jgi:hypothetical protein
VIDDGLRRQTGRGRRAVSGLNPVLSDFCCSKRLTAWDTPTEDTERITVFHYSNEKTAIFTALGAWSAASPNVTL